MSSSPSKSMGRSVVAAARANRNNAELWAFRFQMMRGIAAQYRRRAMALRRLAARRRDATARADEAAKRCALIADLATDQLAPLIDEKWAAVKERDALAARLARIPRWIRRLFGAA